ncbi:MAG: sugar ABC transporter permease [Lachnospiraceae bacterium]|nr:sugar ABC transporter permease [Lachnospiraceae bacterium]
MKKNKVSFVFALPAFAIYTALLVIPIIMALGISFFKWNGFNEMTFVGIDNYVSLFQDARLGNAVINTVIIAGSVIIIVNVLGLVLAMLVNRSSRVNNFFRTIFFIPFVLSAVALSFVWKSILSYNGVLNGFLKTVGLSNLVGNWLGKRGSALICIIIIEIWRTLGYHMMLYLAALQAIPEELYEACTMDGGNRWDKFRNVTLPLIVPGMSVSILMSIINELRIYDVVKIMTDGGPGYATETIVYNIVAQGFSNNIVGYSSAIAVVLFLAIGTLSVFVVTQMGKREVEM